MGEPQKVSYSPASEIRVVKVPLWCMRDSVIQPRADEKDEITLVVTQRFEGETWKLVRLRNGVLLPIALSTIARRHLPQLVPNDQAQLVLYVPQRMIGALQVWPLLADLIGRTSRFTTG